MTGVFIKRGNSDTDTGTKRMPCEYENRDWGDASKSQGIPKRASKPPETRREARNKSSLTVLRRNLPCQNHDLRLLASRTMRQYISVF